MQKPWRLLNSVLVHKLILKLRFFFLVGKGGGGGSQLIQKRSFRLVVVVGRQNGNSSLFVVRRIAYIHCEVCTGAN